LSKNKSAAGRPTKKTDTRVAILLDCLERGMPVQRACEFARVNRSTLHRWKEKDEDFATEVAYSRGVAIKRLILKVEEKEPWKILKNIDSKHFKDQVDITSEQRVLYEVDAGDEEDADEFPGY